MLILLLACADPPPPEAHTLNDLYLPQVQLNTGSLPGGPELVQLFVHPKVPGVCHPIPTISATLDGKPMTRLHGMVEGKEGYDRDCAVFEFTLDAADIVPGPSNELVVTDGVANLEMSVASLFAPRTITPSTATAKPGDSVTLAWSPPTDVLAAKGAIGLELTAGDKRVVVRRADIVFGAGSLTFAVPEGITGQVTGSLFGSVYLGPAVTRCEGAAACGVSREYDVAPFSLQVQP